MKHFPTSIIKIVLLYELNNLILSFGVCDTMLDFTVHAYKQWTSQNISYCKPLVKELSSVGTLSTNYANYMN